MVSDRVFQRDEGQDRVGPERWPRKSTSGPPVGRDASDQRKHDPPAEHPAELFRQGASAAAKAPESHEATAPHHPGQ